MYIAQIGVSFYHSCITQQFTIQLNLCQKLLFWHQLTHNKTTDCSLNYNFNKWKFQAQTWGVHVVYRNCFRHSEEILYTTCSPHVLKKEEVLTKIDLYNKMFRVCLLTIAYVKVCLLIITYVEVYVINKTDLSFLPFPVSINT